MLAEIRFPQSLGPQILQSLRKAQFADVTALAAEEKAWAALLSLSENERSVEAGRWLLQCMKGARHAGVLTAVQEAVAQEKMLGHMGVVWPVIGAVFQLSPVAAFAEYLRLEFQCAARRLPDVSAQPPLGQLTRSVKLTLSSWVGEWTEGEIENNSS